MASVVEEDVDIDARPIRRGSVEFRDADSQSDLEFTGDLQLIDDETRRQVPHTETERATVATRSADSAIASRVDPALSGTIEVWLRTERGPILVHDFATDDVQNMSRFFRVAHLTTNDNLKA